MKPILFNDSKVDTNLFLQLQDLAAVLSGFPELEFEYNYGAFVDILNKKITASHYWDNHKKLETQAGLKTDVFLRAIGTLNYSNIQEMNTYKENIQESSIPKFAMQLFTICEDLRLEEIIRKERPGTQHLFEVRRKNYTYYFDGQLTTNVLRSYALDELYCLIYLLLHSNIVDPIFPKANERQLEELEVLKPLIYSIFDARNTREIAQICEKIVFKLDNIYDDCINQYFIFPVSNTEKFKRNTLFDELTRNDDLINDDTEEVTEEQSEYIDETFSTWHRENKNGSQNQTFLQFELESGTRTKLMGNGVREADEGDQAMASVQGSSGQSKRNEYDSLEALSEKNTNKGSYDGTVYGEENKDAVKIIKVASRPTETEEDVYKAFAKEIEPHKRKLSNTILKTLEHKKNAKSRDLLIGRLSKKLIPLVTDENPRVFYKKNNPSTEIDAVFTLLVDCSASMNNKMDETKKGIVLFHEVLNRLKIPHSIVGFWEDANSVKEGYQPNYFHIISDFSDSLLPNSGAKVMQLEPQEDNRDGYSIRVVAKDLEVRKEKHKFLMVFSDGEPAAASYEKNGIIDTYEAVLETRKKGIEVIGMFLSDGHIEENDEKTMKNIYGKEHILVPSVADLPDYFAPLLKKLLLKSL